MSQHTLKPGDVVKRSNDPGDRREFKVIGEADASPWMLACGPIGNDTVRMPFWPQNLTLVRAAGEGGA